MSLRMHQLTEGDIAGQARVRHVKNLQRRIYEVTALNALKGLGVGLRVLGIHHLRSTGVCARRQCGQRQRHHSYIQASCARHACLVAVEPVRRRSERSIDETMEGEAPLCRLLVKES